jgi:hypothetical protein
MTSHFSHKNHLFQCKSVCGSLHVKQMFIKRLFGVTLPRSAFGDTELIRVRRGLPKDSAFTMTSERLSMRITTVLATTFA